MSELQYESAFAFVSQDCYALANIPDHLKNTFEIACTAIQNCPCLRESNMYCVGHILTEVPNLLPEIRSELMAHKRIWALYFVMEGLE